MKQDEFIPFGLRFEENFAETDYIVPIYDEDQDISVILDEKGCKIPYVEYYGAIGTKTLTKVQSESSDEDQNSSVAGGTRTVTESSKESTDSDTDSFVVSLGTRTETFVRSEQSDQDPSTQFEPRPPLTTRTATKTVSEGTETD